MCAKTAGRAGMISIDPAILAEVDAAAREVIASDEKPGLAVGVVCDGRLIFNHGYGASNVQCTA